MVSDTDQPWINMDQRVLILVLMEYGLWQFVFNSTFKRVLCLNPCSNGIWSLTADYPECETKLQCLNPCSNGIWSLTQGDFRQDRVHRLNPCSNGIWSLTRGCAAPCPKSPPVLILVLMEYGLWRFDKPQPYWVRAVLILVLMEYGLWRNYLAIGTAPLGLNPCSNGIWSLTVHPSTSQ